MTRSSLTLIAVECHRHCAQPTEHLRALTDMKPVDGSVLLSRGGFASGQFTAL
jgi:hypothetical protein